MTNQFPLVLTFGTNVVWVSEVAQWVKNPPANADVGSIPGLGRFPEEGNGNPLQYSCLGKSHG